jgi:hypothetical protein
MRPAAAAGDTDRCGGQEQRGETCEDVLGKHGVT